MLRKICNVCLVLSIIMLVCPISINAALIPPAPVFSTTTTATTIISPTDKWVALPPYNTLWPLWAAPLSPISSITGLPAPIVTSIGPTTILPVQPGLTWDPSLGYPWLLYNTPSGLAYYDPLHGVNLWPPALLTSIITGAPITLTLPVGYQTLPPTSSLWLYSNVPIANQSYISSYSTFTPINTVAAPPSLTSLLTPLQLLL
jgi:hypothetical protein